jgi:hypothetical protein
MALGIRIKLAGVTEEQFDAVNKHADPAANPPKGLLFHASGPIEEGWSVIDFWASRQDFDTFEPWIEAAATAAGAQLQAPPGHQAVLRSRDLRRLAPARSLRRSPNHQLGSYVAGAARRDEGSARPHQRQTRISPWLSGKGVSSGGFKTIQSCHRTSSLATGGRH